MNAKSVKLPIKPCIQLDGHTCGYRAAASVYRYYGLDPDALGLRAYLGTDNILPYAFPGRATIEIWLGGEENFFAGTTPMDLLAVLYWDGFDTECVASPYKKNRDALQEHLELGHPALAVLYSCLHWVVVSGINKRGVHITDSICWGDEGRRRRTYTLSHEDFEREEHGLVFVSRQHKAGIREMTYPAFAREYARGVHFAAAMLGKNITRGIRNRLP